MRVCRSAYDASSRFPPVPRAARPRSNAGQMAVKWRSNVGQTRRLLELLRAWFNPILGGKLLDHLRHWLDPEDLIKGGPFAWRSGALSGATSMHSTHGMRGACAAHEPLRRHVEHAQHARRVWHAHNTAARSCMRSKGRRPRGLSSRSPAPPADTPAPPVPRPSRAGPAPPYPASIRRGGPGGGRDPGPVLAAA
jgi:hypothetical protein